MIKDGQKFKLKKSITLLDLHKIHYSSSAEAVLNTKFFVKLAVNVPKYPERIYYMNHKIGARCFFLNDMVEPYELPDHNHPLTNMFSNKKKLI